MNLIYNKLNNLNFIKPNKKKFPLLKNFKYKFKKTLFETYWFQLNDEL